MLAAGAAGRKAWTPDRDRRARLEGRGRLRVGPAGRANGRLASKVLQRDVAREPMRAVRAPKRRLDVLADAPQLARTPGVEAAARWRATGARYGALEPDRGGPRGGIGHGNRGEQRPRIRVIRRGGELAPRAPPPAPAPAHDARPGGEGAHPAHGVRRGRAS